MAVVEGYKHNEIAAQLNISVAASKTLLHRARKQLQQRITLNDHHYEKQPSWWAIFTSIPSTNSPLFFETNPPSPTTLR